MVRIVDIMSFGGSNPSNPGSYSASFRNVGDSTKVVPAIMYGGTPEVFPLSSLKAENMIFTMSVGLKTNETKHKYIDW